MADLELVRDFVNSADLEGGGDELGSVTGLVAWLAARGLVAAEAAGGEADLRAALAVREALRELLRANNGVEVDRARAAATLDEAGRRAALSVRFDTGSIRLVPQAVGIAGGLGAVLAAAATAMADGSWQRLKACRSDTCRWAFVDTARNRSRQWCSMSVCGNRAKARSFRTRHGAAHA